MYTPLLLLPPPPPMLSTLSSGLRSLTFFRHLLVSFPLTHPLLLLCCTPWRNRKNPDKTNSYSLPALVLLEESTDTHSQFDFKFMRLNLKGTLCVLPLTLLLSWNTVSYCFFLFFKEVFLYSILLRYN